MEAGAAYVVFDLRRQDWKPKDGSASVRQFTVKTETPVLQVSTDEYRFLPISWKAPVDQIDQKFVDKTFIVSIKSASPYDERKEYVVVDFADSKGEVRSRDRPCSPTTTSHFSHVHQGNRYMVHFAHAARMFDITEEKLAAKLDDVVTKPYRALKGSVCGIYPDTKLPGHPFARVMDPTMIVTSTSQVSA